MSDGHSHRHDGHGHDGHRRHDDPDDDDLADDVAGSLTDNPIWQQENVTLASVGIDVGSAGTQVAFSRLHLRRRGEGLTTRYVVVKRETLFESPLYLTPYLADGRIDAGALGRLVDDAYAAAHQQPEDVDTGVVILTGEALRRRNAEPIATVLAERAGDLVCATAGHHMEATLAAYGSGAALESWTRGGRVLSVDIGGGTTKLALLDHGEVVATAALDVGGRLVVVDEEHRVVRLDPAGATHAQRVGLAPRLGEVLDGAGLDAIAAAMSEAVLSAVRAAAAGEPPSADVLDLYVTALLPPTGDLVGVVFSGGVGEYIYEREDRDFGDLGRRLGDALRRRVGQLPGPLLPAAECIRATVLGASQHSVQLSGSTCTITDPARTLPRRNVPVVRPRYELPPLGGADSHAATTRRVADAVRERLAAHVTEGRHDDDVALALHFAGLPLHARVLAFARGLVDGLGGRVMRGLPLVLVLDADVARTLGHVLRDDLGLANDLVVLDGVRLDDFDHIDLGRVRQPSGTVPVTIKSLVFSGVDVRALRADAH